MTPQSFTVFLQVIITLFITDISFVTLAPPCHANQKTTAYGHHDYAPWNWKSGDSIHISQTKSLVRAPGWDLPWCME